MKLLSGAGVLLEVSIVRDGRAHLFICSRRLEALDWEKSEYATYGESSVVKRIDRFEFFPEVVSDETVFVLPSYSSVELFATSTFVDTYERERMTGLEFREVWSS